MNLWLGEVRCIKKFDSSDKCQMGILGFEDRDSIIFFIMGNYSGRGFGFFQKVTIFTMGKKDKISFFSLLKAVET